MMASMTQSVRVTGSSRLFNSAGVCRSDKGDKNIKCEPVETYWVRLELKHKDVAAPADVAKWKTGIENALLERYKLDKKFVSEVKYDKDARLIVVDVKKPIGERATDLSLVAYYMEKDIKIKPLFQDEKPFEVSVEGSKVSMENILVYYVDEKAPTFTRQRLTAGAVFSLHNLSTYMTYFLYLATVFL